MPNKHASQTTVAVSKSQHEIQRLLMDRGGATHYGLLHGLLGDLIVFTLHGVNYKVPIRQPQPNDDHICKTETGKRRTAAAKKTAFAQEERRIWRSAYLYIKAIVVAHEDGLINIQQSLTGFAVLGDGRDVYSHLKFLPSDQLHDPFRQFHQPQLEARS